MREEWRILSALLMLIASGCTPNRFAMPHSPPAEPALFVGSVAYDGSDLGAKWRPRTITLDFRRMDPVKHLFIEGGEEFQIARSFDGGDTTARQIEVYRLRPGLYGAYRVTIEWDPSLNLAPWIEEAYFIANGPVYDGEQIDYELVAIEVRPDAVTYGGEAVILLEDQAGNLVFRPRRNRIAYDEAAARRALGPEVSSDTPLVVVPID